MTCTTKAILLRRRKLGRGSTNGIKDAMENEAQVVRNWRTGDWPREPPAYIFRWGCTSNVPYEEGYTLVNSARSIHWCSDKKQGRLDMQSAGVPVPETWTIPEFLEEDRCDGMYVVRPARHAQGRARAARREGELRGWRRREHATLALVLLLVEEHLRVHAEARGFVTPCGDHAVSLISDP